MYSYSSLPSSHFLFLPRPLCIWVLLFFLLFCFSFCLYFFLSLFLSASLTIPSYFNFCFPHPLFIRPASPSPSSPLRKTCIEWSKHWNGLCSRLAVILTPFHSFLQRFIPLRSRQLLMEGPPSLRLGPIPTLRNGLCCGTRWQALRLWWIQWRPERWAARYFESEKVIPTWRSFFVTDHFPSSYCRWMINPWWCP